MRDVMTSVEREIRNAREHADSHNTIVELTIRQFNQYFSLIRVHKYFNRSDRI